MKILLPRTLLFELEGSKKFIEMFIVKKDIVVIKATQIFLFIPLSLHSAKRVKSPLTSEASPDYMVPSDLLL
jgi:hypothetical protein